MSFIGWIVMIGLAAAALFVAAVCVAAIADRIERRKRK